MRSIHTIKSGDQGKKDYYTKDESLKQGKDQGKDSSQSKGQKNYYSDGEAKSESEEMTQAVWFGKDAERLNLRGHGLQSDFEQIFDGYIPGTNDRIRYDKPREDHQENCIYDVVLSCKKSVSMQIHLGQDERLYKAYQETVKEITELIERDYAQARIQVNGDRRIVQTGGIIALMIPHHTSRDLDMNVHTHLAIANGTYCEDGKWRSLLDRGFSHAYYMGDYFSARMAARVQALGYEIRETVTEEGHPSWELAGYSDEQIKVFSKRSENAKVKELVAAGVSRDDALLRTRKAKNAEETLEEAQGRWKVEADAFEIEAIIPQRRPVTPKLKATAEQVLESAIRHYGNRSNHFTRDQIREYAFKLNRSFTVADLDKAIASHPELIDYGKLRGVDELRGHFTTVQAVEREIRTIKAWMQGQGQAIPILEREAAAQALEAIQLKTGQRSAIIGVLVSDNQHQIIHGLSGVGKTTALRQLKMLTDRQQVDVLGFAPSIDAAKKLSKELGIDTHTVQSLVKSKRFELKPNQLLVIDEAGMVSAEMLDIVMQKANAAGARVLLVGDTGQNQAIEAGSPMRSLMKHGAEVHHIAEIIRQQNSIQKQAVELIAKGRGLDALSLLNEHDYINPMPERERRVSALAAEYLALSPEEQLNTLIVAGTNAEKDAITAEIRAGLKAEGRLGESQTVIQLRDRALTPEEAKQIAYYRVGDYIKFSRHYKRISERNYERTWLQKNVPYQVVGKDGNELIVSTAGGRRFRVNPSLMKDKQVFEGHEFDIAVGDSLRWTSSNQEKGQINGKTFKITALNGNVATILTDDGLRQIDLSEALAVDYTLTSTSYRAQGSDRPRVFVSATNDPTSNREPFYVSISRQIKELKVWTDDYEGLKRRVAESSVQSNPLELIGEVYERVRGNQFNSRSVKSTQPSEVQPESIRARIQAFAGDEAANGRYAGHLNRHSENNGFSSDESADAEAEPRKNRQTDHTDTGICSEIRVPHQGSDRASSEIRTQQQTARKTSGKPQLGIKGSPVKSHVEHKPFEQNGERYVGQNNRSESPRVTARSNSRIKPNGNDSRIKRLRANIDLPSGESSLIGRGAGNEGDDRELTRGDRGAHQSSAETSRGEKPNFSVVGATTGNRSGTARNRQGEYRVIGSEFGTARGEHRGSETANQINGAEQERNVAPDLFSTAIRGLPALADAIVQIRLQRELAQPLAQLKSTLIEMSEVSQANEQLKAAIEQRLTALDQQKADFLAEQESVAQAKATLLDMLQAHLAQSKVEVLDTALQEWQSLRSGDEALQLSDQAIAPSEQVELSELLQNYPAQKAVQFAMEEYYQASEQVIDMQSTLKTGIPVFRVDDLSEFRNEPNEDTMPTKTVEPPRRKSQSPQPTSKPTKRQPSTKPAKANPAFWQPLYPARVPSHIEPHHWDEFKRSAIHPDLIALNAESVSGQEVYERLLSERLAQLGTGQYVTQPMARLMAQYEQVAEGGWWGKAGIDAKSLLNLQPGQQPQLSTWGCFKADNPRLDQGKTDRKGQDEYIKYENPLGVSRSLYLPIVPDTLANRIYKKHGIQPTAAEKRSGFWYVVRQYNLPITITEGAKKTWASLSQGEITIGLSGVNGIYQARDIEGKLLPERLLNDQMAVFATPGREFRFAFDQDTKASTVRTVRRDRVRGIELLEAQGCICKVASWKPEEGKGLDDFIINRGPLAYTQAIATAQTSDQDKRIHYRTEYNAIARQVRVNYPEATPEFLDAEVYLRTIAKAEAKDGDRFLSQGDNARSLKSPQQVQAYVDHIKTHAPQIQYRYENALAAQATAEAQRVAARAEYVAIAQQVKTELGDIPAQQLDMEVCLRTGANGNVDRVLAQSDQAITLNDLVQVQTYVEGIKTDAPQYLQQQQEREAAQAQQRELEMAKAAAQAQRQKELEAAQAAAQAQQQQQELEAAQAAAQRQKELADAQAKAQAAAQAKALAQQQPILDRANYEKLAQQVRNQLYEIPSNQFDAFVYKWAQTKGLDGDRILAQSDIALTLKSPREVSGYVGRMKQLAKRIIEVPGADVSDQQRQLNKRAAISCNWLARTCGKQQADGWTVFEDNQFSYHAKDGEYKIYSRAAGRTVLEHGNNRLVGTLSSKEVEKLELAVKKGKTMIAERRQAQIKAKEIKKSRGKGRRH